MIYKVKKGVNLCVTCGQMYPSRMSLLGVGPRGGQVKMCPKCGVDESKSTGKSVFRSKASVLAYVKLYEQYSNEFNPEPDLTPYNKKAQEFGIPMNICPWNQR